MSGMRRAGFLLAFLLIIPMTGLAQDSSGERAAEGSSWLSRTLEKYFGGANRQAEFLDGAAVQVSSKYLEHSGKTIAVVIVHQVDSFKPGWDQKKPSSMRLLTGLTGSLQTYTRDGIIRDYLLFEAGEVVDPFDLADSEVLLRQLPYINDVRLRVVPLVGENDTVAIVVETTDRWPFGVDGRVIKAEKYSLDVYSENVGGLGLRWSNTFLHDSFEDPNWGYRGRLSKQNIEGTFWNALLEMEDSFDRRSWLIRLQRTLAHPGLRSLGGISFLRDDQFSGDVAPRKYDDFDTWYGRVVPLFSDATNPGESRALLVPAARYINRRYTRRPVATADSNRGVHDREIILGGLTYQRSKPYKTSFLAGDGETETLPVGISAQLAAGYEHREFQDRAPLAADLFWSSLRHRGDVHFLRLQAACFLRKGRAEEGMLKLGLGHFTRLAEVGSQRLRGYFKLQYALGLERYPQDRLYLGDRSGIRDLANGEVIGNQRLVGTLEGRMFSSLSLLGFRFSFIAFADAGMVGAEDASSLFKEKVYLSTGLGLRLRNPNLVLPTVQLQASFLSNVHTPGLAFSVKVGNTAPARLNFPGTMPALPPYE